MNIKLSAAALLLTLLPLFAVAAEEVTITIKDHKFTPSEVRIPAGQKVKLVTY